MRYIPNWIIALGRHASVRKIAAGMFEELPKYLFLTSILLGTFTWGYESRRNHWFPYELVHSARTTAGNIWFQFHGYRNYPLVASIRHIAPGSRMHRIFAFAGDAFSEDFLVSGGPRQFLDLCPEYGCLAVEFSRAGTPVKTIPFLPSQYEHPTIRDAKYEQLFFDPSKNLIPMGVTPLPGGDYLVGFEVTGAFPFGGGVARVHENGTLAWYRRDYAHHWPSIGRNGQIIVPSRVPSSKDWLRRIFGAGNTPTCRGIPLNDAVEVLDLNGRLLDRFSVEDALVGSGYGGILVSSPDPCDLVHLNLVREAGDAMAARLKDVRSDDFLVSMRNVSALAIIGRRTHIVKRVFRGTFQFQHAAQPMSNGDIILFDNFGVAADGKPSRVLQLDPVTGQEITLFPTAATWNGVSHYSATGGFIALSQDGTRALVAVNLSGFCYEVRLSDGVVLSYYDNVHSLKGEAASQMAGFDRFGIGQVVYVNRGS